MALATMAGADVLRATIDFPRQGPWTAGVRIAGDAIPSGVVEISFADGPSFRGTVRRAGGDGKGAVSALIVGGADGLRASVAGHFRRGHARDVLSAIVQASGETQEEDLASDVLGVSWSLYTLSGTCNSALETLAAAVSRSFGSEVNWRILASGRLWMGRDMWDEAPLGKTDAVLDQDPAIRRYVLGVDMPTVEVGVSIAGVGNVASVRHQVTADRIRSVVLTG